MSYVVGLDIGTTSTIGILIELPGRIVALASRPVALHAPHPAWAEEDPVQWWDNTCSITQELLAAEPRARGALAGIGVAGMVPAMVLLDRDGTLIRRSIQQSDGRCAAEVAALRQEVDEAEFLRATGNGINQQLMAAKLRWLERHEPDNHARIATIFGSYDYINWRLTGIRGVERNWALESGFIDLASGAVSDRLVALAHLPPGTLPPMHPGHHVIGQVSPGAASLTGLPAALPVVAGAADHVASAYAAGIVAEGDVLLKFGGAGDILLATAEARPDPRMFLDYHVLPSLFMPNGCMACTGSLLNWIVRNFTGGAVSGVPAPHAHLDRMAAEIPAGSDGVFLLPYFLGEKSPLHDPHARGTLSGLSLNHGVAHVWRAALEGTALAFRHHVEVFREIGYPVRRLLASDGGAGSAVWMQIMADVVQAPVQLLRAHPGSCLGAAWVAAMGTGVASDWADIGRMVGQGNLIEPQPRHAAQYDAQYAQFRALYEQLSPWFARNAAAAG